MLAPSPADKSYAVWTVFSFIWDKKLNGELENDFVILERKHVNKWILTLYLNKVDDFYF